MEENRASIELMIINWVSEILSTYYSEEMRNKIIYDGLKAYIDKSVEEKLISSTEERIALDIIEKYKVK